MSLASLFGGISLANAPLGAVHGFAGPIGGTILVPHGAICARLLPLVMEKNIKALESGRGDPAWLKRYEDIARALTGKSDAQAMLGVEFVYMMREKLNIDPLSKYGMTIKHIPDLVEKSSKASSMKGNAVSLSMEEMETILLEAL